MRLLKTLVLFTGIAVLLPSPPDDPKQPAERQAKAEVSTPRYIGSATMAFADAASFCDRQPQVCKTAGYVASKLEAKAKYSVRLIYEWASESNAEPQVSPLANQASADPIETSSMAAAQVKPRGGQSNLKIEDLIPPWRGPAASKKS
jgi:hypothetical protein